MFRGHGHDMRARAAGGVHHALQRQVVGLRCAAGEHDLARRGPGQFRNPLARHFHGRFRFPSEAVRTACRIAEFRPEVRKHRFQHTRIHRRGGVIIQIDGFRHSWSDLPIVGTACNPEYN